MCIRHFPIHLLHMLINTRKKIRQHFRTKCSFNHINLPSIARISDTVRIKRLWPEVETAQQHWKPVTFSDLHNNQGREPHPWPNRISWEGGRKYYAHRSHSQDLTWALDVRNRGLLVLWAPGSPQSTLHLGDNQSRCTPSHRSPPLLFTHPPVPP